VIGVGGTDSGQSGCLPHCVDRLFLTASSLHVCQPVAHSLHEPGTLRVCNMGLSYSIAMQ
jgi:hypothetical protein